MNRPSTPALLYEPLKFTPTSLVSNVRVGCVLPPRYTLVAFILPAISFTSVCLLKKAGHSYGIGAVAVNLKVQPLKWLET